MNYLAHSHLSYQYPDLLVGNYIADMVTNKEVALLPASYLDGIALHRHIDTFTDQHPAVRAATALLRQTQGKYAPVVVDVLYDYILAQVWTTFCNEPIDVVIHRVYSCLETALPALPPRIHPKITGMIKENVLISYTSITGISGTMRYLAKRARFDNRFDIAASELIEHYDELLDGFLEFYPMLQASCQPYLPPAQS